MSRKSSFKDEETIGMRKKTKLKRRLRSKGLLSGSLMIVPVSVGSFEIIGALQNEGLSAKYYRQLKTLSGLNDEELSDLLNINVKTFRKYRDTKGEVDVKPPQKEQVVNLLGLYRHGIDVFGGIKEFAEWLDKENFFFDGSKPLTYLKTLTGIKFVDRRLTGLEYGDNA
jgi:uncharacterized protein (DUF2384 family)